MKIDGRGRIGVHHEDLVIGGTRNGRGSGDRVIRGLGSHESLLGERIGKHSRLGRDKIRRN